MADALCERGLWLPPRDLQAIPEVLEAAEPLAGCESVLPRIRALVGEQRALAIEEASQ